MNKITLRTGQVIPLDEFKRWSNTKQRDNRLTKTMSDKEGEKYFHTMLMQIKKYEPDQIVAVARSGFSYAMWVAQILKLPLGVYYNNTQLVIENNSKRIVFVDDNIMSGTTFATTKDFMSQNYPSVEWSWAVLFCDWQTSETIKKEIIYGTELTYYATQPFWGSRKVGLGLGIRARDEGI